MISLTAAGFDQPEQDRDEIARLLQNYSVCLLRNGAVALVCCTSIRPGRLSYSLGRDFAYEHSSDGLSEAPYDNGLDIIRVFPPGTRLRVTVEVIE
jgi:hypothetical protein